MKRMLAFLLIVVVSIGVICATSPSLFKNTRLGLDLKGGFEILYQAKPLNEGGKVTKESLNETAKSLEKRVNQSGVSEPEVTTEGADRIRIRIAGLDESKEAKLREDLVKPANLTFRSAVGCAKDAGYCKIELTGNDFKEGGATIFQDNLGRLRHLHQAQKCIRLCQSYRRCGQACRDRQQPAGDLPGQQRAVPS